MSALFWPSLAFMAGGAAGWAAARFYLAKPAQILSEPRPNRTVEDIVREVSE